MNQPTYRLVCLMTGLALLAWQTAQADIGPATQTALAATQPTTQPSPAVAALVAKLGDDSFKVREKAQAELIRLGDDAETSLRALLTTDLTPEAKARVEASLRKIQENRLIGPSVITLHYKDAPLETVLNDFTKQAGADMGIHRREVAEFLRGKTATVDVDHVSFWKALQEVSQSSGLGIPMYNNGKGRMTLEIPGRFGPGIDLTTEGVTISGPFIVIPLQCTLTHVVNYGHAPGIGMRVAMGMMGMANGNSQFTLNLICLCEPKLRIVGGINNDWLKQITDDKGHDLLGNNGDNMFYNMGQSWSWQMPAQLHEVPDLGKKIALLKGVIAANVRTKSTDFVVEDVFQSGSVTKKIGNLTITFSGATMQANQALLNFAITVQGGDPNAYNQIQMLISEMQVTDAGGNSIQVNQHSMGGDGTHMTLTVGSFSPDGQKPKKLVWEIPSDTQQVELPFEIHDLPLPQ